MQAHSTQKQLQHELLSYKEWKDSYKEGSMWILNTSLSAGDTVSEDDFTKIIFQTQDVSALTSSFEPSTLSGFAAKTALKKGTIATDEMFYSASDFSNDVRFVEATDFILPENLKEQHYIDIRVCFPNGEDYIVISHKKVLKLLSDDDGVYGVQLELNEEELLRLSSARVDRELYDNCSLYLLPYRMDFQETSEPDYPVNPDVFELMNWDPNIVALFTVPKELEMRATLENHLKVFLQNEEQDLDTGSKDDSTSGEDTTSSESLTVYQPQDDGL